MNASRLETNKYTMNMFGEGCHHYNICYSMCRLIIIVAALAVTTTTGFTSTTTTTTFGRGSQHHNVWGAPRVVVVSSSSCARQLSRMDDDDNDIKTDDDNATIAVTTLSSNDKNNNDNDNREQQESTVAASSPTTTAMKVDVVDESEHDAAVMNRLLRPFQYGELLQTIVGRSIFVVVVFGFLLQFFGYSYIIEYEDDIVTTTTDSNGIVLTSKVKHTKPPKFRIGTIEERDFLQEIRRDMKQQQQ